MRIKLDSDYMEPKPRKFHKIHCFTCKRDLKSKAAASVHRGHDVDYLDEKLERMS